MQDYEELREHSYRVNMLLPKYGLIDLTFGNVSVIDRSNGIVAIKPSGVPYDDLRPEQIVLVTLDGEKVDGNLNPSSDTILFYFKFDYIFATHCFQPRLPDTVLRDRGLIFSRQYCFFFKEF